MSELALIERIAEGTTIRPGTALGIGDDAALVELGGLTVATHDMLVEDVHFRLSTTTPGDLGAKALAVNVSDIAAMGAVPVAALVGLGIPAGMADDDVAALSAGIEEVAAAHGMTVAGGDVTGAPVLVVGITALGRPEDGVAPVRRDTGRAGDVLCVTGPLGAAAAGLVLLESPGLLPGLAGRDALIAAHRRPRPRVMAGRALARGGARAMMDLSDGLALDAARLARASGLRAVIDLPSVPVAPGAAAVAAATGADPAVAAATGGEDYELLAAVPPERVEALTRALGGGLRPVGVLAGGPSGVALVDGDGAEVVPERLGWEHRG
ncbi:MAG: thiamine-phosphate kinase [Thermoleophilia bacterium]